MRHLIIKFIYLFLLSVLVIPSASASDDSQSDYVVTLSDDTDNEDDDNRPETGNTGRRDYIWSTTCHISPDRIDILSIDKESIVYFELYDQNGLYIGSFFNETDFLSAVFTIREKLKIRIVLDFFTLSGYLEVS